MILFLRQWHDSYAGFLLVFIESHLGSGVCYILIIFLNMKWEPPPHFCNQDIWELLGSRSSPQSAVVHGIHNSNFPCNSSNQGKIKPRLFSLAQFISHSHGKVAESIKSPNKKVIIFLFLWSRCNESKVSSSGEFLLHCQTAVVILEDRINYLPRSSWVFQWD